VRVNGIPADGTEIPVPAGATITFGEFSEMRVDLIVKSTLEVRNAFGNVARDTSEFSVEAGDGKVARVNGPIPTFASRRATSLFGSHAHAQARASTLAARTEGR
jgi:hypothetical protein